MLEVGYTRCGRVARGFSWVRAGGREGPLGHVRTGVGPGFCSRRCRWVRPRQVRATCAPGRRCTGGRGPERNSSRRCRGGPGVRDLRGLRLRRRRGREASPETRRRRWGCWVAGRWSSHGLLQNVRLERLTGFPEQFAELESRLMQLRFAVSGRTFEHGGDLIVLVTFDVVQDKDHAIAGGQGGDGT